jgi:DNA-binding NarL/FixJ family response regulator
MTDRTLRVLLLEDSSEDAELIAHTLRRAGMRVVTERVATRDEFERALHEFTPDVVLSDHSLSQFNAPAALDVLRAVRPVTPLIVVSGALDAKMAVACVRAGAEDLIVKHELHRLPQAIESALAIRQRIETLSPRQLQVLGLVSQGLTTKQVAERLGISDKTVETHRGEIMKRTGLHDVVSLVRFAIRLGLVPAAD